MQLVGVTSPESFYINVGTFHIKNIFLLTNLYSKNVCYTRLLENERSEYEQNLYIITACEQ